MPFCSKCGAEVPENVSFCPKCGNALQGKQITSETSTTAPPASNASTQAGQPENLSLWGYYVKCLKNYVNFKGRARRREYWGFTLFNIIILFVLAFLGVIISGIADDEGTVGIVLSYLYSFAVFLPSLGVLVRRLHDIGNSASSLFWLLIPIVGWIIFLTWLFKDSDNSSLTEYEYGPCPKISAGN